MTAHHHHESDIRRQEDASITVWPYLMSVALLLVTLAGTCWLQWELWFAPQDYPGTIFFSVTLWERLTVTGMCVFCVGGSGLLVYLSHRRIVRALNATRQLCVRGDAQ